MAVTITNKFYETSTPGWHDISKIVFTSPNLNSPANAGTRSHILPGQADLGLWYEDTSKMYRIMGDQELGPAPGTQVSYMDIIDLYPGEVYNFATENSVLVTIESITGVAIQSGNKVYNDIDNYGVVSNVTTLTSGTPSYEARTIRIYGGELNAPFYENRRKGYSYKVYWTTTGIYTDEFVDIYYSTNGGLDWQTVASGVENSGVANFTIPVDSTAAQLKVVSTTTQSISASSMVFRVDSGTFNVLTPATSALWRNRNTHRVWWNCERFFMNELVGISISFNTGNSWTSLATNLANTGFASVDIPSTISSQCVIKVYSMADPTEAFDISSVFSTYAGDTDILVPSSSTILRNRNAAKVWWNSGAFYNDESVNIKISYNSGDTWTTLASGVTNTGFAVVDLLETTSIYTKIKVESFVDPSYAYDISDNFQTVPGSFVLLTPSVGASWLNRHDHKVWWNSLSFYSTEYVDVDISYDDSYSWFSLASGILNTGNCTVMLPIDYSGLYSVIRVKSNQDPLKAYTTTTFTVVSGSTINIEYPQNNNILGNGTDHTIWWNSTNFYSSINMLKIASANLISGPTVSGALLNKEYDISGVILVPFLERIIYNPGSGYINSIYGTAASVDNFFIEVEFDEPKLINNLLINIEAQSLNLNTYTIFLSVYGTNVSFNGGYYTTILLNKNVGQVTFSDTILSNTSYFSRYRVCVGIYANYNADQSLASLPYLYFDVTTAILRGVDDEESSRDKVDILVMDSNNNIVYTLASGIANVGFKNVNIPYNFSTISGSKLLIRDTSNPEYLQDKIAMTIASGTLPLLYPTTSGINMIKGEPLYLWWNSNYIYEDSFVSLGLSTDSGNNYSLFEEKIMNEGTYSWVLPMNSAAGNTNKLAVFKNDGTEGVEGTSEFTFVIEEPYISIISPTSGTVVRLYSGDEYWFTACSGIPTLGYEPINYKLYWETNIRNNKNVQVFLSVDGGTTWSLLEDTFNTGIYSILEDIVMLDNVYTNCRLKVTHSNTAGTLLSSISDPFIIEKPWQKITNNLYSMDSWETNFFYKDYFYKMYANNIVIYRMAVSGTDYEPFVSFTEDVVAAPMLALKNDNIYVLNTKNKAFYEYLSDEANWRTLTPTPVVCKSLESFSDTEPYLYAVSEAGSVYRFNTDTYGAWSKIYTNKNSNTYTKAGVTAVTGSTYTGILVYDGAQIVDVNNSGVTVISGALTPGIVNNYYDLVSVPSTADTGYLFSIGELVGLNQIYNYIISGSNISLTPSGCLHCLTDFQQFHSGQLMTSGTYYSNSDVLNFDIEVSGGSAFSFVNNSNYILECPISSGTALFDQDYTYFSKKETTDNAVSSSFVFDSAVLVATGDVGKVPFLKIDLASGTIGFPDGVTYFDNYYPLRNSYVGRKYDIMCTDNTFVYKFDGYQEQGFYKIDLVSGAITYLTSPPVILGEFPQVVYNLVANSIYMIHDDTDVNNLWKYDIISDTWSNTEDSLSVIIKSMLNSSGSYIYALEGEPGRYNLTRYDVIQDTWESLSDRPAGETIPTVSGTYMLGLLDSCVNDSYIYALGRYTMLPVATSPTPVINTNIVGEIICSVNEPPVNRCMNTRPDNAYYTCSFSVGGGTIPPKSSPTTGGITVNWLLRTQTVVGGTSTNVTGAVGNFVIRTTFEHNVFSLCNLGITFRSDDAMTKSFFISGAAMIYRSLKTSGTSPNVTFTSPALFSMNGISNINPIFTGGIAGTEYAFPTAAVAIEIVFSFTVGELPAAKDYQSVSLVWQSEDGLDVGSVAISELNKEYSIGRDGLVVSFSPVAPNDKINITTFSSLLISYVPVRSSSSLAMELCLLEYDISQDIWRTLLERIGISNSLLSCNKAKCVCDNDFIYILWNEEGDGEEIEIFKIKLNQIDYASVAIPVGWESPPLDLTQSTPPVGWVAPMEKADSMPYTWTAPSNFDYLLEPTPSDWAAPQTNVLSAQPGTWVPPSAATLEPAPNGWVAPVASGSREPVGPVYGPSFSVIANGPPLVQTPYAKSINFSSRVGTKEISDSDNLYVWGINSADAAWLNVYNSIVFEITNGECYNCRLTAWDDITHQSTVRNTLLSSDRCRVHALAFSSGSSISPIYSGASLAAVITKSILTPPAYVNGNRYLIGGIGVGAWAGKDYQIAQSSATAWTYTILAVGDRVYVTDEAYYYYRTATGIEKRYFNLYDFVKEPVHDQILKGNVSYYGDFNMRYRYQEAVHGDYLMFKPYLYNIDGTISHGVHDFFITLHYSYT